MKLYVLNFCYINMIVVINVAFIQMGKYVRMRKKKLELTGIGWKMKN